jgi:hypothetical protein
MPQVTFQPLPVLQEGEGLEEEEIENDNTQGVTVNFVTGEDSWTLVQRCKKNKKDKNNKNEKWNAQQKCNFVRYGDIYRGEPYKSYRNVDIGPPLAIAQPQQPVVQQPIAPLQQLYPPIPLPYIPPAPPVLPAPPPAAPPQLPPQPPVASLQPPHPAILAAPPPKPFAPAGRKRHRLEAIPEEDEPLEAHRPRLAEPLPSPPSPLPPPPSLPSSSSSDDFDTPPSSPSRAERRRKSNKEDLSDTFGHLALSGDVDLRKQGDEIPSDTRGEGATKIPGPSKFLQHGLAEAGPPSQRTRQMEKELEKTLLKRYEEAKALQKKKKKEKAIKKEQP